jgi:hypothetical protein
MAQSGKELTACPEESEQSGTQINLLPKATKKQF